MSSNKIYCCNDDYFLQNSIAMGCNSSSVVPFGGSEIDGAGIKVRVNPSTPETIKLSPKSEESKKSLPKRPTQSVLESSEPPIETLSKDFNSYEISRGPPPPPPPPPPTAFEVRINEESLIKKHPPKRFRRLEEQQSDLKALTHTEIDGKQQKAEMRRKEILIQRIRSAQKSLSNRKMIHSDALTQQSEEVIDWERTMI